MTTITALTCGEKISDWTLINPEGERHWLCKCKCGIEKRVDKYTLVKGVSKRCRTCASKEMQRSKFAKDLSGKTYSDWTVVSRSDGEFQEPRWNCRCKCGHEQTVSGATLKRGQSKSCRSCSTKKRPRPLGLKSFKNLQGKIFGKWKVIKRNPTQYGRSYWLCACGCGNNSNVSAQTLLNGDSSGCKKCYKPDGHPTHGYCKGGKIPEYHIWNSIKNRCLNPNTKGYQNYGGRGVTICDEWSNSFEAFYKYIGPKPFKGASIDRIDNDGNYEPGNIRWATRKQQMSNTRKQKYGICIRQWSMENNLDRFHVADCLRDGMDLSEIKKTVRKPFRDY